MSIAAIGLSPGPALGQEAETCFGLEPTIVGDKGSNRLVGTVGDDVIVGMGGTTRSSGARATTRSAAATRRTA